MTFYGPQVRMQAEAWAALSLVLYAGLADLSTEKFKNHEFSSLFIAFTSLAHPSYSTFLTVDGEYVSKIWSKLVATLSLAMPLSRKTA